MDVPNSTRPSLTIRRRLRAPPRLVYQAWTDPARIMQWWGPGPIAPLSAEADVRVGGRFRVVMAAPGGEHHDVSGTYREVVPDRRLVFTWAWRTTPERESLVTLAFDGEGAETLLTLTHERFADEAARDDHRSGWDQALDKLERLFA